MKDWKPIAAVLTAVSLFILLIPTLLVLSSLGKDESGEQIDQSQAESEWTALLNDPAVEVAVYRTASEEIEKFPLEQYIVGVVAAEMPAEFELEALKAQAIAARTYVVRQLNQGNTEGLPEGANVSDSVANQVFLSEAELKKSWGSKFAKKIDKIRQAVAETAGQVITYDGKPIDASFFSTSNGFTENSEDYWENEIPYLRSVESPWDKESPKFTQEKTFTVQEFEEKLGVKVTSEDIGKVLSRTAGERIKQIEIGGQVFTGREVREKLELASSDFSWVLRGDEMIVTTEGYGHGVGMSQYGANGMAKAGKTYQDIVTYYYQDVAISEAEPFLKPYMVKK